MEPFAVRDVAIGRITGEGIIRVSAQLLWVDRPHTTVNHDAVGGVWRFSVSASMWLRTNSPDCYKAGQIIDDVARLRTPLARRIVALWHTWHLNDMRAACAHQEWVVNGDYRAVPPCPETGYRCGSAWLVEVIPDDVLNDMRALIADLAQVAATEGMRWT